MKNPSQRFKELDEIGRRRALTEAESLELEREVYLLQGKSLRPGLTRELARHGIKRI